MSLSKDEELNAILSEKTLSLLSKQESLDLSLMFFEKTNLNELIEELITRMKENLHVKEINLQSNELSSLPKSLSKIQIQKLLLGKNNFTQIPCLFLSEHETLQELYLNNNLLQGDSWFGGDENFQLSVLDLSYNSITQIPKTFADQMNLSKLTELRINSNKLNQYPVFLKDCVNLKLLYLNSNQLSEIEEIKGLDSLEELKLEENQLKYIPKGLSSCKKLKRLFLNTNQIDEISDEIYCLKSLEVLTLHSNQIQKISSDIKNLSNLTQLNLHQNKISKIPEEICELPLKEISLFSNEISELPENIYKLNQLNCLYLQQNKLSKLPETMQKMTNLEELDLFQNQFKTFPNWIGELTQLKKLSLESNDLKFLPGEIKLLTNLVDLNVENNPNLLK
jgi:Leucine-rich repeat (LRR) protein